MLNYFRGGPHDGAAYQTSTLLDATQGRVSITEYKWTPEIIVSEKTGSSARVWLWKQLIVEGTDEPVGTTTVLEDNDTANDLTARRNALKLSRGQLAEMTGLTQAKIARIEKGGPRTTPDEMAILSDALDLRAEAQA